MGVLKRSEFYYNRVKSYANVRMISTAVNTYDLIDNSKAVATSCGSAGWEALVRGVPPLLFGGFWYQPCKSVFSIKTLKDAVKAIEKIESGYKPDPLDVERYTQSIYMACEKNLFISTSDVGIYDGLEASADRIAKAIYKRYCNFYSTAAKETSVSI